jgi:ParB-like chromosome segregation protein Spo0J
MNAPAKMTQHPLSAAFPRPSAAEAQALSDSIATIGVQQPITVYGGQVIDGWSRYCAATELGMDCPMVELDDTDPRDFAKSQAARRNLTPSQTAMVITEIFKWKPVGANQHKTGSTQNVEPPTVAKSSSELATMAGVHVNTITQAKAVQTHAVPEVQAAVKSGAIGLPKAVAIAKLPKAEQAAATTKPLPKLYSVNPADADEPEDTGPDSEELVAQAAAEISDRHAMQLLLDADDKLATAVREIRRLNAEVILLKQSRDAAMNRAAELVKWVKRRDFQITQLTKEIAAQKRGAA